MNPDSIKGQCIRRYLGHNFLKLWRVCKKEFASCFTNTGNHKVSHLNEILKPAGFSKLVNWVDQAF